MGKKICEHLPFEKTNEATTSNEEKKTGLKHSSATFETDISISAAL